jgi:hypothetical protein
VGAGLLDALGLAMRAATLFVYLLILGDLIHLAQVNGPVVRAMRHMWISSIMLLVAPMIGILERVTDFLPGEDLYMLVSQWNWILYGVVITAGIRMRMVLRSEETTAWLHNHKEKWGD